MIAPLTALVHELCHAAVALEIGVRVCSIHIYPTSGGLCRTRNGQHPRREFVLRAVTVSFAGVIAAELSGNGTRIGCGADLMDIQKALNTIADPWDRAAISREARRTAERIVNEQWYALCRVAERLEGEGRRRLTGREVRELLAPRRRAA